MTTEMTKTSGMILEMTPVQARETAINAIKIVREIIEQRPDKLVVKGKQYIELQDWELIGLYFGDMHGWIL